MNPQVLLPVPSSKVENTRPRYGKLQPSDKSVSVCSSVCWYLPGRRSEPLEGQKMDRELYLTALQVLSRFTRREGQDSHQVNELRRKARLDEMDLPIDDLCCRIIHGQLNELRCLTINKQRPSIRLVS
jgi:hypothetical protein